MRSLLLGLALCVAVAVATTWRELDSSYTFEKYVAEFGKEYAAGSDEYKRRETLFYNSLKAILVHNADHTKTWKEGVNMFTDMTHEEFAVRLGYRKDIGYVRRAMDKVAYTPLSPERIAALPASLDWRTQGAVTPVKDQGRCGSCWAFASAEALESAYFINSGKLVELSEQQIASCTSNPEDCGGSGGCDGGTAEVAYASAVTANGLSSEWTYPYSSYGGQNFQCQFGSGTPVVAPISSYTKLPENQALPLLNAVVQQPIAISVDASAWKGYESGVFNGCNQTNPDVNHAVLLVGYGTDPTTSEDYWIVRNSWSPNWGDNGYILLHRDDPNNPVCGVDLWPEHGSGCKGGPPTVAVCGTCGILYDNVYPNV